MNNEQQAARDAAIEKIKEDAQKYNHRHISSPLSVPSVQIDDFSLRLGFDAGYAARDAEVEAVRERYNELIMAVSHKYAGETRHQTALKYIQRAEQGSDEPCADTGLSAYRKAENGY